MNIPQLLIEIKPSRIVKGSVGVFAVVDIKKAERVAEGIAMDDFDKIVPWGEFEIFSKEIKDKVMSFCVGTPEGFVPPDDLDFNKLSIEWYFNHSCDGNLGFDKNGDFVAIKDIKRGEELSYDYGLAESNPKFKMICKCKINHCRKVITGNDWKILKKDKSKRQYMHPFLLSSPLPISPAPQKPVTLL
jgi:SET domain-containing protein